MVRPQRPFLRGKGLCCAVLCMSSGLAPQLAEYPATASVCARRMSSAGQPSFYRKERVWLQTENAFATFLKRGDTAGTDECYVQTDDVRDPWCPGKRIRVRLADVVKVLRRHR